MSDNILGIYDDCSVFDCLEGRVVFQSFVYRLSRDGTLGSTEVPSTREVVCVVEKRSYLDNVVHVFVGRGTFQRPCYDNKRL